jgi:hypothetical protein
MVDIMSAAPSEHNMLAAWDKYAPAFQQEVAEYQNAETDRLLQERLTAFRASLLAAHQSNEDESDSTPQPDFEQLRTDCEAIFVNNLPAFQAPTAKNLLKMFFLAFLGATLLIIGIGVAAMAQAYLLSLLGGITIAAFHFKGLAVTAAIGGGAAASLSAVGMFSPAKVVTCIHLNEFIKNVETPAETPVFRA